MCPELPSISTFGVAFHLRRRGGCPASVLWRPYSTDSGDEGKQVKYKEAPTLSFIGLNFSSELWRDTNYANGVIIAVLDSGIAPDHPSFNDKAMLPPPAKWKGKFEFHEPSNKIIGAEIIEEKGLPLDYDGHGTHMASIAAGTVVCGAHLFGQVSTTITGVAPLVHLAIYKVGDDGGDKEAWTSNENLLLYKAIDKAVTDGADVISISISYSSVNLMDDPACEGALKAIRNGVLVVCYAGNYGPELSTVRNVAPWILTVGASMVVRRFRVKVLLSNFTGDTFAGVDRRMHQ